MKRRKPIHFQGFDWTELMQLEKIATKWPNRHKITVDKETLYDHLNNKEDALNAMVIKEYLYSLCACEADKRIRHKNANYVRKFLLACSKYDTFERPIYKGLAACQNDETLIRWVCDVLGRLWT